MRTRRKDRWSFRFNVCLFDFVMTEMFGGSGTFTPMYLFAARKPLDSASQRQTRVV